MRHSIKYIAACTGAVAFFAAAGVALASHGKEGLWSVTITMGGSAPNMPDMSQLPPEAVARMKAMGMSMGGNTITTQHCMTAQEVAMDAPHLDPDQQRSCKMSNMTHDGHSMSADVTCSGRFEGNGHMHFTYDSDTHYAGELTMTGIVNGQPMSRDQKFEGRWISADCGSISH